MSFGVSRLQSLSDPAAPHLPALISVSLPSSLLQRHRLAVPCQTFSSFRTCSSLCLECLLPYHLAVFPDVTLSIGPFLTAHFKIAAPSMYTHPHTHSHTHTHALQHIFVILLLSLSHCIFFLVFVTFPYMYKLPTYVVYCLSLPIK